MNKHSHNAVEARKSPAMSVMSFSGKAQITTRTRPASNRNLFLRNAAIICMNMPMTMPIGKKSIQVDASMVYIVFCIIFMLKFVALLAACSLCHENVRPASGFKKQERL